MQFSNTTSKNGIIQNIESLCKLGDAGITGNATLFSKITHYVNQAYFKVVSGLIEVDKSWVWDDSNYSNFNRAVKTLVASQQDYTLPAATISGNASTLLRVNKIAVLDNNSTPQEKVLQLTDLPEAILNNMYPTAGLPFVYKLIGNSVKMWPSPSSTYVTLTDGLIVYFERTPDEFTTSDTTQEPGFPAPYHDLLCLDASATHLLPTDPKQAALYLTLFTSRLELLKDEYANRNDDSKNKIRTIYRNPR